MFACTSPKYKYFHVVHDGAFLPPTQIVFFLPRLCLIFFFLFTQAAEALGAIAEEKSLPILKSYLTDPADVVRQTCELAIEKIKYEITRKKGKVVEKIPKR